MDRRQRKTRQAIFQSFTALLSQKPFHRITVGEIIEKADIGRATFYAHFETREDLLQAFCQELFCHIFDTEQRDSTHRHIFDCEGADSPFLHLFYHVQKNDNHILSLLGSENNELFGVYFRRSLSLLVEHQYPLFAPKKPKNIPEDFWKNHITATLWETLNWWLQNGRIQSPETITEYFLSCV